MKQKVEYKVGQKIMMLINIGSMKAGDILTIDIVDSTDKIQPVCVKGCWLCNNWFELLKEKDRLDIICEKLGELDDSRMSGSYFKAEIYSDLSGSIKNYLDEDISKFGHDKKHKSPIEALDSLIEEAKTKEKTIKLSNGTEISERKILSLLRKAGE